MRLVNENIKAVAESPDGLAWLYTLLRFNVLKLVPLSRNSNYQSKDLAHTQDGVSRGLAALYGRNQGSLWARTYARLCLAAVPRGGGNGDAIRLEILDIMRRHGIKEGHRPGIEDRFLEDWHQKLHTNCAPDDIIIAEAYIKFLECNSPDAYWGHLKANGLSWEYMCAIGGGKGAANSGVDGMRATPLFLPQLIGDIKHLRWTLMQAPPPTPPPSTPRNHFGGRFRGGAAGGLHSTYRHRVTAAARGRRCTGARTWTSSSSRRWGAWTGTCRAS